MLLPPTTLVIQNTNLIPGGESEREIFSGTRWCGAGERERTRVGFTGSPGIGDLDLCLFLCSGTANVSLACWYWLSRLSRPTTETQQLVVS